MFQSNPRSLRAGLAGCALLLGVSAAKAQYVIDDEILPPRAVAWRLADRGFTGISRPRFDGRAYVVEAFAPNGGRVRLFVDAGDGAILGRQRLDPPPAALARPMPGYGWTEEDETPRRPMRQAERLLPPADIPMPETRGVPMPETRGVSIPETCGVPAPETRGAPSRRSRAPEVGTARPDGSPDAPGRTSGDLNPQGLNPDARGRSEPARRAARVESPGRPDRAGEGRAAARTAPAAPRPEPVDAAKAGAAKGDAAKTEATQIATLKTEAAKAEAPPKVPAATPAAVQPPSEDSIAAKPAPTKQSAAKQTWTDPPEGKRNVRVIGGATIVPGTAEKEPGPAQ